MNEAYEVELNDITASFIAEPFTVVLGVERQTTLKVESDDKVQGFTDVEWQVIYARALVDDRWTILPQTLYDEIDDEHGEMIGDLLWKLTCSL
jgi:hypothetical protein